MVSVLCFKLVLLSSYICQLKRIQAPVATSNDDGTLFSSSSTFTLSPVNLPTTAWARYFQGFKHCLLFFLVSRRCPGFFELAGPNAGRQVQDAAKVVIHAVLKPTPRLPSRNYESGRRFNVAALIAMSPRLVGSLEMQSRDAFELVSKVTLRFWHCLNRKIFDRWLDAVNFNDHSNTMYVYSSYKAQNVWYSWLFVKIWFLTWEISALRKISSSVHLVPTVYSKIMVITKQFIPWHHSNSKIIFCNLFNFD